MSNQIASSSNAHSTSDGSSAQGNVTFGIGFKGLACAAGFGSESAISGGASAVGDSASSQPSVINSQEVPTSTVSASMRSEPAVEVEGRRGARSIASGVPGLRAFGKALSHITSRAGSGKERAPLDISQCKNSFAPVGSNTAGAVGGQAILPVQQQLRSVASPTKSTSDSFAPGVEWISLSKSSVELVGPAFSAGSQIAATDVVSAERVNAIAVVSAEHVNAIAVEPSDPCMTARTPEIGGSLARSGGNPASISFAPSVELSTGPALDAREGETFLVPWVSFKVGGMLQTMVL